MKNIDDFEKELFKTVENLFQDKKVAIPAFVAAAGAVGYYFRDRININIPEVTSAAAPVGAIAVSLVGYLMWGVALVVLLILARKGWVHYYNSKIYTYLQILPNTDDKVTVETLGEFVRRVHGAQRGSIRRMMWGREWFTFVIHHTDGKGGEPEYLFYIGAPVDRLGSIKNHMSALYASAEFYPVSEDIKFPGPKAAGGRLATRRKKGGATLSLSRYKKDQLPGVLKVMEPGTWVQLSFSPESEHVLKQRIREAEKDVKEGKGWRDRDAFEVEEERSFKTRFSGSEVSYNVTVAIASENYRGWGVVRDVSDALIGIMNDVNELKYRRLPFAPNVRRFPLPYPHKMVWTGSEMAKIFHLPELSGSTVAEQVAAHIPHGTKGGRQLGKNVLSDKKGVLMGELVHPVIKGREVRIEHNAFGKHWFLSGRTGSGKSTVLNTLLKSFIEQSLKGGRAPGFSFMDPKKETATIILNNVMKKELEGEPVDWEKIKWISFKGAEHPPAMNLLYRMPGVDDTVLTDQIMRIIRENNPNQAAQAERLLKKCIQTLIADKEVEHTILGIEPLLYNPSFNKQVLTRLKKDPEHAGLVDFWEYQSEKLVMQSGDAIMNRLDVFFSNTFMKRIFGQTDFTFPIRKWMDEGYMILYDFSGMSEEETGIIGSYLSYLYYRVADTRPDRSLMHQLIIDEAQRVKASILNYVIAEMRSKGLSLGISTQTGEQLPPDLQRDLANIAANVFVCQQGENGAATAAKAFKKPGPDGKDYFVYTEGFFKEIPELTCAIKTQDKGKVVYAVVKVPPLDRYLPDGSIADYNEVKVEGRPSQIDKANEWTYKKAKELEAKNGLSVPEVDKRIENYLHPKSKKQDEQKISKMRAPDTPTKVVDDSDIFSALEDE